MEIGNINLSASISAFTDCKMQVNYAIIPSVPVERSRASDMDNKTYEMVIQYIKSEIISGRLKPGGKLPPERELAKQLEISRTSIREALRTMEVMGVVESVQGAGNYISVNFEKSMTETLSMMFLLRQTDGRQLSDIRAALELKATELAVTRITDEQVEELERILSQMNTDDEKTASDLDRHLHQLISCASGNPILIQILNAMSVLIDDFIKDIRQSILQSGDNKERLLGIHRAIVEAIQQRDYSAAQKALKHHDEIIKEYLNK